MAGFLRILGNRRQGLSVARCAVVRPETMLDIQLEALAAEPIPQPYVMNTLNWLAGGLGVILFIGILPFIIAALASLAVGG